MRRWREFRACKLTKKKHKKREKKAQNIVFVFCPSPSAQSSKTSGFSQDNESNRRDLIDCGPVGMHRKSIEAAEHLKSGGEDSGNDLHGGSGPSPPPHLGHHPGAGGPGAGGGGPTSSESGQESQDGMGPSSSSSGEFCRELRLSYVMDV